MKEHFQVLIIDDDEVIAQSTAEYFNMFDVPTAYVTDYDAAVRFLEEHVISLLLLDINLGGKSGFDLCRKVRENYDMPILFISARTSDDDVLIALNIGGDDYIKKPFTLSILLAKVKAILSRYAHAKESAKENLPDPVAGKAAGTFENRNGLIRLTDTVSLDTNMHKLLSGKQQLPLKAMEYKLLTYLIENAGRIVTKEELLKNVWEDEYIGEGTLAVHIRHLREKTERDPKEPVLIKTVWGVGYVIEGTESDEELP
ncbi:MAG: response regulator transcription factor [Lachnospiraceae bacterium]|nr:response regulator transcription factor [Lachnospiraceae bacterium]